MSKAMDEREQVLEDKGKRKDKLPFKLTKDNFLILALLGILLLVIAWPVGEKETDSRQDSSQTGFEQIIDVQNKSKAEESSMSFGDVEDGTLAYGTYLEETLEEILSAMEGAGKVKVMITMESSGETVLEKDVTTMRAGTTEVDSAGGSRNTTDISQQQQTIYTQGNGSGQIPYVKKINFPKVEGVLVAVQGGSDANVVKNISEAIQALFDIEPHKIKIVKMNT